MIPYGRQDITEADIDAVADVLRSDFLTQGPMVTRFEDAVAQNCGVSNAVAVNSATSALHLACLALGLGPGDKLWTSANTFVASANCALYCGAEVDFVDIDPRTYNLSIEHLKEKLIKADKLGHLPKILIPVHLCGQSCDMDAIHKLSKQYSFKIIEDASHAIGGKYKGERIGNCRYSDIVIFSFHPVKIITTAEGGMALTNDAKLAKIMRLLSRHGITRAASEMTDEQEGPWYYEQIALGYNYRMSDLHAALGLSQLARLDQYVNRRHILAKRYDEALRSLPISTPFRHQDSYSAFHLYVIRLKLDKINKTHREVFEALRDHNIGVNLHYIPVHTHPYFIKLGFSKSDYPEALKYYNEAISLPLFPMMSDTDQNEVIKTLFEVLN